MDLTEETNDRNKKLNGDISNELYHRLIALCIESIHLNAERSQ